MHETHAALSGSAPRSGAPFAAAVDQRETVQLGESLCFLPQDGIPESADPDSTVGPTKGLVIVLQERRNV